MFLIQVVYINCFKIENAPSTLRQIDVSSNKDILPREYKPNSNIVDKTYFFRNNIKK